MGDKTLPFPSFSLLTLDLTAYQPEACPLCREGKPVVKPGSRKFS